MKGPALPVEKKVFFEFCLAYNTPWPPMSVHKKFQPNRSSRLAGYREHIYDCLVLLYRRLRYARTKMQQTQNKAWFYSQDNFFKKIFLNLI